MSELRNRAHQAVLALGKRGLTTRIPDAVRATVLVYARAERERATPWQQIAREVGLSASVLKRWTNGRRPSGEQGRLLPVRLKEKRANARSVAAGDGLVLVVPGGYRLEGLTLADATALVAALR